MASTPAKHARPAALLSLALLVCAACCAPSSSAQDPAPASKPPDPVNALRQLGDIELDAASIEFEYRTNQVVFKDVKISQGDTRIEAERAEATGLDTENSRWTFIGDVKVDAEPRGNLRADRAVVEFRNNRIARATVTGSPAQFEQQLQDADRRARGRAETIEYDVSAGTVKLTEDAWLTDGRTIKEIGGPLIVYNIREERVQAASKPGTQERVRIIISPRKGDTDAAGAKPTAAPASENKGNETP